MANENLDENMAQEEIIPPIPETPQRVNPFCVISLETYGEHDVHDIQTNSSWNKNPYGEAYAVVPDELVPDILATSGYCDIELNEDDTEVISFTAREIPEAKVEEPQPTVEDDLMAMAIDHEYRLTLLELGV